MSWILGYLSGLIPVPSRILLYVLYKNQCVRAVRRFASRSIVVSRQERNLAPQWVTSNPGIWTFPWRYLLSALMRIAAVARWALSAWAYTCVHKRLIDILISMDNCILCLSKLPPSVLSHTTFDWCTLKSFDKTRPLNDNNSTNPTRFSQVSTARAHASLSSREPDMIDIWSSISDLLLDDRSCAIINWVSSIDSLFR